MGSHRMTPNPTRPQGAREKFDLGTLGDVDEISAPGALFFGPWLQKVTSPQQILDPPRSDHGVPRNHAALRLEQDRRAKFV